MYYNIGIKHINIKTQIFINRHFEGANAVPTLAKNVGSLCLFYFPLTTLSIYEYVTNESYDTIAAKCCLIFLMLSPISNCIIFGFGNKVTN